MDRRWLSNGNYGRKAGCGRFKPAEWAARHVAEKDKCQNVAPGSQSECYGVVRAHRATGEERVQGTPKSGLDS